jgi:hypothetical protein
MQESEFTGCVNKVQGKGANSAKKSPSEGRSFHLRATEEGCAHFGWSFKPARRFRN